MESHYNQDYFNWQKKSGQGAVLGSARWFAPHIGDNDTVLDFGCGGGYLLAALPGKHKYGVEINPTARKEAESLGLKVYAHITDVPQEVRPDVVISHHALEHVVNPYEVLQGLAGLLRPGGVLVMVVPIDDWRDERRYVPGDINQHIYTWTPLLFGNLVTMAGFRVESARVIGYTLIRGTRLFKKMLPSFLFDFLCRAKAFFGRAHHVYLIARKV